MKTRHLVMPVVFLFLLVPGTWLARAADDSAGRQAEWYEDIDVPSEGDKGASAPGNGDLSVFDRWQRRFDSERAAGKPSPEFRVSGTVSAATDQSPVLEFLKKTDQSTPYAWDPVGTGKELVNERVVKPMQRGFDQGYGTEPQPASRFPQENTIDINVRRPSEMSFYERNAPKVKKLVGDPKMSDGSMEILSTLQTIQHLINCKRAGTDPRVCAREYLINKGAARAVFEVLKYTGLVTHGVVFSLVYADYQAIKNIMKAHEVTSAMWDDYQQALRQQKDNDQSDMVNWGGRLDHLRVRTELFADRYVTVQEEIGAQLLIAWAEADDKVKAAQQARSRLEQALEKYRTNDFVDRLKAACQLDEEGQASAAGGRECRSVIDRAMARTGTSSRLITEVGMDPLLRDELVARFSAVCEQADSGCAAAREAIRSEVAEPSDLGELLTLVTEAEQAVEQADGNLAEYERNVQMINGRLNNMVLFLRSRIEDLHWPDAEERRRAEAMIDTMEQRVTGFQPSRMRFDTMAGYRQAIDNLKSDLGYLEEMPRRIIAERDRQLAALEAAGEQLAGDSGDGGCGEVERLTECIDRCKQLDRRYREFLANTSYRQAHEVLGSLQESGCPYAGDIVLNVVVPSVVGMGEREAKGVMAEHGLTLHLDATRTPDREEAQRGITYQVPAAGREVNWGSGVDGRVFIFDQSAPPTVCVELKDRYRSHLVRKEPDFGQGERVLAKAAELDCFWTAAGREHLAASRASYERFVRDEAAETERLCREYHARYTEAMVTTHPDFEQGKRILHQAEACAWIDRAWEHFVQSRESFDESIAAQRKAEEEELLAQQRKRCERWLQEFESDLSAEPQQFDTARAILGKANGCDWYDWGMKWFEQNRVEHNQNVAMRNRAHKQCQELFATFRKTLQQANKSLDPAPVEAVLEKGRSCDWYGANKALLPCIKGEYAALRSYNANDLQQAAGYVQWGRENGCPYADRVASMIASKQRENTFLQEFSSAMDDFNRQLDAQFEQTLQTAIENKMRKERNKQGHTGRQQHVHPSKSPAASKSNSSMSCAQIDAQALQACRQGNEAWFDSLSRQWDALGCRGGPSPALEQCMDAYVDQWFKQQGWPP